MEFYWSRLFLIIFILSKTTSQLFSAGYQILAFCYRGGQGRAPPKRLLPSPKTFLPPKIFQTHKRKNNRNNSQVFKSNGVLSFAPPLKIFRVENQNMHFIYFNGKPTPLEILKKWICQLPWNYFTGNSHFSKNILLEIQLVSSVWDRISTSPNLTTWISSSSRSIWSRYPVLEYDITFPTIEKTWRTLCYRT